MIKCEAQPPHELQQIGHELEESAEEIFATTLCLTMAEALATDPEVEARIAAAIEALDDTMSTIRKAVLDLSLREATFG